LMLSTRCRNDIGCGTHEIDAILSRRRESPKID